MKKIKGLISAFSTLVALGALVMYINGCGGGGGKDASTAAVITPASASGKVAAAVTLTGRVAGRTVGVTTGSVTVKITISGTYSENGEAYEPIVETVTIDLSEGYATIRVLDVPIGINHLMVAEADWGGGVIETVKAIIPEVEAGQTTSVNANDQTTAVARVALAYADQENITLADIDADTLALIQLGVEYLVVNGAYADVSASEVIALLDELDAVTAVAVTPATASVAFGATQTFIAALTDSGGQAVTASPTWSVTSTIGTIDSNGVFTATGLGTGAVTATFGAVSDSAEVTVSAVCSADPDCDDNDAATYDVCTNGSTASAICVNTPYTCVIDTDCDDGNPDTNDVCTNGGTTSAVCSNPIAAACFSNAECDDANSGTIDTCYNSGTISAVCGHSTNVAAGNITADTTWNLAGSPYILAGQVQVDTGVTLTIEPGVIVQFDYPNAGTDLFGSGDATLSGLRVDGTLNAVGTAASPITFTLSAGSLSNGAGFWGGIYFTSSSTGSALQYANMEYPSYALIISGSAPAVSNVAITNAAAPQNMGMARRISKTSSRTTHIQIGASSTISVTDLTSNFSMSDISISYAAGATGAYNGLSLSYLSGASNSLSNIVIDGSLYTALTLYEVSNLAITNLDITNSVDSGISATNITDVSCTNCSVTNAGYYGGSFNSFTNLTLSSCVFNNSMGAGLYLYGMNGTNTITNCDASFNSSAGLYYESASGGSLAITGSRFAQNCAVGLYLYSYGYETGVSVTDSNVVDNASIGVYGSSNIVSLNGVYLAGNNGASAGAVDASTATPDSGSTPQQYMGVNSIISPAASAISGPPTTSGSVVCGY